MKWIKCSERLPETIIKYLNVMLLYNPYAYMSEKGKLEIRYKNKIDYWMPFPEEPNPTNS